jgi:TRAP-type C4-dicarboxylate transport system permease large subunit
MDLPPIDSYFISTVVTCGLPTALLFMWILLKATRMSWRSFRSAEAGSPDQRLWRIAAALMPVLILNSLFGNTFTLYSVAPIGWLLIGWISSQQLGQVAAVSQVQTRASKATAFGEEREQFAI